MSGRDQAREDGERSMLDVVPCGLLVTAHGGALIEVNRTFTDWLGYRREDLVGHKRFVDLLTAGGRIFHETHLAPLLELHGGASELALDLVAADGSRLPALVNASVRSVHGERQVLLAVFAAEDRRAYERELLEARRRAERSEQEARELSSTLQQTLIPPRVPTVAGLDIATAYRPAGTGQIGGDFYDVFPIRRDDWMIVLGDVQGKGAGAAAITSLVRYTMRAAAVEHDDPSDVLRVVNEVLIGYDTDRSCTAVVMRARRAEGRWNLTISCGGHPMPLIARLGERPEEVGRPGSLLGLFSDTTFSDVELTLRTGEVVVMYTDGVSEAARGDEFFGERRIARAMHAGERSAADLTAGLLDAVLEFTDGRPRDDIAIVAVAARDGGAQPGR